jgi:hypothetical protein
LDGFTGTPSYISLFRLFLVVHILASNIHLHPVSPSHLRPRLTPGYAAIDQICDYYTSLEQRDVKSSVKPGYLLEQLSSASRPPPS